jgi:hypothetical protein
MGIAAVELAAQRKATEWYIKADAFPCVLTRNVRVPNGAGGYVMASLPLPSQNLRMNPLQDIGRERQTADGRVATPQYVLIGTYDADIQRFDTFTKDGRDYQVVFMVENQQYQVKGEVIYLG